MARAKENVERKWVMVFLEIALRALRRVHLDFGVWGAGRQWKMSEKRARLINLGAGVELADERTVCAAITQEFMTSQAVSGTWTDKTGTELRFFEIDREQPYKHYCLDGKSDSDTSRWVDMVIRKRKAGKLVNKPSYIEVKRAHRWTIRNWNARSLRPGSPTYSDIMEDIRKLKCERDKSANAILIHVLVWGVYSPTNKQLIHPCRFFEELQDRIDRKLIGPKLRWMPIEWLGPSDTLCEPVLVTKWVWIGLAEITKEPYSPPSRTPRTKARRKNRAA